MNGAGYWSTNVQFCSGSSTSRRAAEGSPWRLFPCKTRLSEIKEHREREAQLLVGTFSPWGLLPHQLLCDYVRNIKWCRTGSRNQASKAMDLLIDIRQYKKKTHLHISIYHAAVSKYAMFHTDPSYTRENMASITPWHTHVNFFVKTGIPSLGSYNFISLLQILIKLCIFT